jgi:surface protein
MVPQKNLMRSFFLLGVCFFLYHISLGQLADFVTVWKTDNPGTSGSNQITIPAGNGSFNYSVNWGDGSTSSGVAGSITKTYAVAGTYTVRISGTFTAISFNGTGDRQKILEVKQWGFNRVWNTFLNAFSGCTNMIVTATDAPIFGFGTSCQGMFQNCTSLNQNLNGWNTTEVISMDFMFAGCTSFNQPLGNWNVMKVNNMNAMFMGASSFNQPLNTWSTNSLINSPNMFNGATSFNQPLSNWSMANNFDVSGMFQNAASFNQPIGGWAVGNVQSMARMFQGATDFNQPLGNWNTIKVANMIDMFNGATAFNQPLDGFEINVVSNMSRMLDNCGMNQANYDQTLNAWGGPGRVLLNNVFLGAVGRLYCSSAAARASLISTKGWNITGDAPAGMNANLSSAVGTNAQTVCQNTAITPITYTTTGVSGVSFSGLPAGVTGSYQNNVVTISGTPAVQGNYFYTGTFSGPCGTITRTGTINVQLQGTISLSSAAGTNAQNLCINSTLSTITYTTQNATGAGFTGLPLGVTGSWANNVVTISGIPAQAGLFNYTVNLTTGCGVASANGSIQVRPLNTISLTSAAGTNSQTACLNESITPISYTTTGATNAQVIGLIANLSGSWHDNTVTIAGSATNTGLLNYSVHTIGGCGPVSTTGSILVTLPPTIIHKPSSGAVSQSACINSPMTSIQYNVTNANSATFEGLPPGVTGSLSGQVVTISGTPLALGNFNFKVNIIGACKTISSTGAIGVGPGYTIQLTSAPGTTTQSLCTGQSIEIIRYATTGASGATFLGLPSGVTGFWSGNEVVIHGTPNSGAGVFNYSVTLTGVGNCPSPNITGSITVKPNRTVTLAQGSNINQAVCQFVAISPIRFNITGATDATVNGLPPGVTGTWIDNGITISGTPTGTGQFNFQVIPNGCGTAIGSGSIFVFEAQLVNAGPAMAPICGGETSPPLGGSFGGNASLAIWSDGGAGGFFANNQGATPGLATYTPHPNATGTITLRLTTLGGTCTSRFDTKPLVINSQATWLGLTSDWGTATNWSSGVVPSICTQVIINNGTPFMPTISGTTHSAKSINLGPGATINVLPNARLNITGK